ncbi:hypothetical protein WISP_104425 [Willisornis vidua]|uniref:Uncharacterized protein n=1 Tax=Willisornis vidua TaxID=1566151 RepID=A0ABQ9D0D2_9PASS|nr:hypothetical protein WISP_104425 [Willisornis vidua]
MLFPSCKRDTQRKCAMSVSKENILCKCTKISDESKKESLCTMSKIEEGLMGKIRLRIHEQMDLNAALFNEKLEGLKRRVEQIECAKTHEEITKRLLSEMKERKLEVHIIEDDHDNSEDFEAISTSSFKDPCLAKDPSCPELAEEFKDPPRNPRTRRSLHVKSKGDGIAMDPSRH